MIARFLKQPLILCETLLFAGSDKDLQSTGDLQKPAR